MSATNKPSGRSRLWSKDPGITEGQIAQARLVVLVYQRNPNSIDRYDYNDAVALLRQIDHDFDPRQFFEQAQRGQRSLHRRH